MDRSIYLAWVLVPHPRLSSDTCRDLKGLQKNPPTTTQAQGNMDTRYDIKNHYSLIINLLIAYHAKTSLILSFNKLIGDIKDLFYIIDMKHIVYIIGRGYQ